MSSKVPSPPTIRTAGLSSVDVEVDAAAGVGAAADADADVVWSCAIALSAMSAQVVCFVKEADGGVCTAQGDLN